MEQLRETHAGLIGEGVVALESTAEYVDPNRSPGGPSTAVSQRQPAETVCNDALAPLLMSLTMLLVTRAGAASRVGLVMRSMSDAGFRDTLHVPLARGESLVVARK